MRNYTGLALIINGVEVPMVTASVIEDYTDKAKTELKTTASFAKDAIRELRKGNFKIALAQVQEAEMHVQEAKVLLKEMNHLIEMESANNNVRRATTLSNEINDRERELEELEKQLVKVKEAATKETIPDPEKEQPPETNAN